MLCVKGGFDHGVGYFRWFRINAWFIKGLLSRMLGSFCTIRQCIQGGRSDDQGP